MPNDPRRWSLLAMALAVPVVRYLLRRPRAAAARRACVSCGGEALSLGAVPAAPRFAGQAYESMQAALYACGHCHLQFKWPRPPAAERDALYQSASHDHWGADVPRGDWPVVREALTRALPAQASVLDVGCFDGGFLATLPPSWETYGVEINPAAARVAAGRGVTLFERVPERRFSAAVAIDIIEHVDDPRALLRQLAAVADVVVISTGNSHAPTARLMGSRYWYVANPEHVSFINPEWCRGTGVEVVSMTRIAHEVRPLATRVRQAAANALYLLAPWLVRRLRGGASDPPSWIAARDHFVVVFRGS